MRDSSYDGELARLWPERWARPLQDPSDQEWDFALPETALKEAARDVMRRRRRWSLQLLKVAAFAALSLVLVACATLDSHHRHRTINTIFDLLQEFTARSKGALDHDGRPARGNGTAGPSGNGTNSSDDVGTDSSPGHLLLPWPEARAKAVHVVDSLTGEQIQDLVHGRWTQGPGFYVGNLAPVPEQGIPPLKMEDASSGFRLKNPTLRGTTTQFPCLLALASTWDERLVSRAASGIAREFVGKGANILLGPSVNVHRTAYGGRNFEYLSGEDPYLGSRLATAYIKSVQAEGVMTVVKHFAFNEQETARMHESSEVDEHTAWELYYPPFEAAIEAGATAVMCSYNQVNGTSACANDALLHRDLRERLGFEGFVMSDWTATHSTKALENGLDMEMPYAKYFTDDKLLKDVPSRAVRAAAVRVLSAVYRMRLDEKPGCVPPCFREIKSNQRTEAHIRLARDAATESVTLLKNDGVLPLDSTKVKRLAVLGRAAHVEDVPKEFAASPYAGGGSGHVLAPYVVTPLSAIRKRAKEAGIEVLADTDSNATGDAAGKATGNATVNASDNTTALALQADVVIIVACALSHEGVDRHSLALAWKADHLISTIAKLRPTVVLMQTPGAVLTPWRNEVAAVANLFYGGEQTGNAWAAVLFGDHAPTGKLPIVFPATEEDTIEPGWATPPFHYYSVPYVEGLSTSYRSQIFRSAFPFGHGLSYTRFHFEHPRVDLGPDCGEAACLSMNITNVGNSSGTEVAQAYLQFVGMLSEPRFALRGFQKTRLLRPGERQELLFEFTRRDLSVYNVTSGWEQQHEVRVHLGASSEDIRHVIDLAAKTTIVAVAMKLAQR